MATNTRKVDLYYDDPSVGLSFQMFSAERMVRSRPVRFKCLAFTCAEA